MYPAFKIEGLLNFFLASQNLKKWGQIKLEIIRHVITWKL